MLAKLQSEQPVENTEIITLAFHVDYWDYLGWKDEFSSAEFSRRQNDYSNALKLDSNYTPQMIVDGKSEFVGSNWGKAISEIGKAREIEKSKVEIVQNENSLKIKIENLDLEKNAKVFLAIAESGLETNVRRGENQGKKLNHESVVREFREIGKVNLLNKKFEDEAKLTLNSAWKKENLKVVVFVQAETSREIYALGAKEIT